VVKLGTIRGLGPANYYYCWSCVGRGVTRIFFSRAHAGVQNAPHIISHYINTKTAIGDGVVGHIPTTSIDFAKIYFKNLSSSNYYIYQR